MRPLVGRALLVCLVLTSAVAAQDKEPAPAKPAPVSPVIVVEPVVPLRANVVVARYDGEKRISSLPYTLSFNAARRGTAQVRMGADIPTAVAPSGDGAAAKGTGYDFIGTQVDCNISPGDDGRYVLQISISEKSVYGDGQGPSIVRGGHPSFRSYRSVNTVVLKIGESTQFTAAADRLTGEIVRVEVTLQSAK